MSKSFNFALSIVSLMIPSLRAFAETPAPEEILLWPDSAPGALADTENDKPSITIFHAPKDKAVGTCVIICPGGGYWNLMTGYEGQEMAQWLNSIGVTGIVLKYRLIQYDYHHPAWLQDAQRAISLVRSNAKQWNIHPDRIGIGGFSAGGHLSSATGVHFKDRAYKPKDQIDQISCRPDFLILVYPVITTSLMGKEFTNSLIGKDGEKKLIKDISTDLHVTSETPPAFLVHGSNDKMVSPQHSINFYLALRKAGVGAEMHLYQDGPHGFGMGQTQNTGAVKDHSQAIASWPDTCQAWMKDLGMLDKKTTDQ